jgi:hypothetical protein
MLYARQKPRGFGIDDKPVCPNCRKSTSLERRAPDAEHGIHYERQIFICRDCGLQIERSVDADGKAPVRILTNLITGPVRKSSGSTG